MHRTDNATSSLSQPAISPVGSNPGGFFTSGTKATTLPTRCDVDLLNSLQNEICNVLEAAGITPDKTLQNQLLAAINILNNNGTVIIASPLTQNLRVFKIFTLSGDLNFAPAAGQSLKITTKLVANKVADSTYNNYLALGASIINLFPASDTGFSLNASGVIGSSGARISQFDNDTVIFANSATRGITQHAIKTYIDNFNYQQTVCYLTGYTDYPIVANSTVNLSKGGSGSDFNSAIALYYPAFNDGNFEIINFTVHSTVNPTTTYTFSLVDRFVNIALCTLTSGQFSKSVAGPITGYNIAQSPTVEIVTASGAATTGRISYSMLLRRVF